jgi:hypothetical protein
MGGYNPSRQYGLVIYTDDYQGEAHRSYVYNALGWKVSDSTASYLESKTASPNLHVKLARELMERSPILGHENVELLKNNLPRHSAKMLSFKTLSQALLDAFPNLTSEHYQDVLNQLVNFVGVLNKIRPNEIALLDLSRRKRVREISLAGSAPLWSAYFRIAGRIFSGKFPGWEEKLRVLNAEYTTGSFTGDLFNPLNPAWAAHKVAVVGAKGIQIRNNPEARRGAWTLLSKVLGIEAPLAAPAGKPEKPSLAAEEIILQQRLTKDLPGARPNGQLNGQANGRTLEKSKPAPGDHSAATVNGQKNTSPVPAPAGNPQTKTLAGVGTTNPHRKLFEEGKMRLEKLNAVAPGVGK